MARHTCLTSCYVAAKAALCAIGLWLCACGGESVSGTAGPRAEDGGGTSLEPGPATQTPDGNTMGDGSVPTQSDDSGMAIPEDGGNVDSPDASECLQSINAFCHGGPAACGDDFDAGKQVAVTAYCSPGSNAFAGICNGYNTVLTSRGDGAEFGYYDTTSGSLVAVVGVGNQGLQCIAGPSHFVIPDCSPSTSLCPSPADASEDALTSSGTH